MDGETIAAIATPLGVGGIGVIRISGPEALQVAGQVVHLAKGKTPAELAGYTCAFGRALDREGEIDEVVVTVFRAPHSYTGEDVVELSAHGGVYLLNRLLRACCDAGARLALAGEFTKRAFLNGKLDLTQAEAVIDLISAQGKQAARAALTAKDGALYRQAEQLSQRLLEEIAHLSAWIDYPEEEMDQVDPVRLEETLRQVTNSLETLLQRYDAGRIFREGIDTVIVGRPNAGKSTLMNLLAGTGRSIVTDIAGTTRDVVTDTVRLGEILLRLSDTAGIRRTADPIEQAGVQLAEERLRQAQLVLAVFDGSQPLDENDRRVIEQCRGCCCIALVNKEDLPQQLETEVLQTSFPRLVTLSARSQQGRDRLEQEIRQLFQLEQFDPAAAVLANERQRAAIGTACRETKEALEALQQGISYDAICVCLENAVQALLELTGKRASQEVVDQVFSRFCVGK